ncbi:MAG: selenocysteine-specific translation elongation factor [Gemmatimonadaceae bacterium]
MILGTAGHIDHGKTALVKVLTGVDTDRLPEEKRRGITIDLGFAPLVLEGIGTVGIVDVPGHEAFVRTMLAGASGIDVALLVVAADEGVMPQTREHLQILSLLAIPSLVVALTKSDLASDEWLALARDDVRSLLADTPFASSDIVAVSSVRKSGLAELREALARAMKKSHSDSRASDVFRMPVDRAFTIKGTGTVVTGTVWSGTISREMSVRIFPLGRQSRVRAVQQHGVAVKTAGPGERVALALSDVDVGDVSRGSVVVAGGAWLPTSRVEAEIEITDDTVHVGPRTRLRFHVGTSDVGARIAGAEPGSGESFISTVVLEEPLLLRGGDRFVLRLPSPARTIGGGRIRDPFPRRRAGRKKSDASASGKSFSKMVAEAGIEGLELSILPIRLGITPAEAAEISRNPGIIELKSRLYDHGVVDELEQKLYGAISKHVETFPLDPGVQLQSLRSMTDAAPELIDLILDRLVKAKSVEIRQSVVIPSGWTARLNEREQRLSESILHEICTHESEPPAVSELTLTFGQSTPALLRYLERKGELVKVSDDRYYAPEVVESMVWKLRSALEPGQVYSPAELREVLGVSRKYLIPFLEFCDASGVTDRTPEGRVVGVSGVSERLKTPIA